MEYSSSSLHHSIVLATVIMLFTIVQIQCVRELRPSDHGLAYEQQSDQDDGGASQQEMLTFFGPATPSLDKVPKPEAQNISDTWLNERRPMHRDVAAGGTDHKDHVRMMLLVAGGVCGLTGVVLLVVSGFLYVFRIMRSKNEKDEVEGEKKSTSAASSSTVALASNCADNQK